MASVLNFDATPCAEAMTKSLVTIGMLITAQFTMFWREGIRPICRLALIEAFLCLDRISFFEPLAAQTDN